MSWDKNTWSCSQIDNTIKLLKEFNEPYKLTVLGKVKGLGLNDDFDTGFDDNGYPKIKYYEIRKLEYKNTIILEQMHRTYDCDSDDTLLSIQFEKGKEPEKWPLEIYIDGENFVDIDENDDKYVG